MANLKTWVLGAGLGLAGLMPKVAEGQDTLTHADVRKQLYDVAERVDFDSWNEEVVQYPGAVMVLFSSSCVIPEDEHIDKNMELIYVKLTNKFLNKKVNGLPIKFTSYDSCGKSKANLFGVRTIETHMYLNGREIDRLRGGPIHESSIPEWYDFLSTQWIPTNLTAPNSEYAWKFRGTAQEQRIATQP